MTLRLAIMATMALLAIAVWPLDHKTPRRDGDRSARRILMRGLVRSLCPESCEIVDVDGLATPLTLDGSTQIAGAPSPGDQVDVLARFTGGGYLALSIVRRS